MRYSKATRLTAFLCSVLAITIVDAEMCKWVDESGCVHYAETCPEGVKSTAVEIQAPPPPTQVDEANKRSVDMRPQQTKGEDMPSKPAKLSTFDIDQMRDSCIKARLSLNALSREVPVYYDRQGQLQAELHQSVQFDRSGSYLSADALKSAKKHWNLVKQDNCTSAVSGSEIKRGIKQKQKEHQKEQCEFWSAELEYMERSRGFHSEHLDLKKLFNANCK